MKLSEWAKKHDVTYKTAWKWFHNGQLPVRAEQLETGTILVYEDEPRSPLKGSAVTIYSRVSSHDHKEDLKRQTGRLQQFASAKGWTVKDIVEEIGSGLNGRRKKLQRVLSNPDVLMILVEHRDRLTRFGFEFIEASLMSQGRSIIVADDTEETADIWQDFIDLVTSMCARIYGKREARNRANKAIEAIREEK